MNAVILLARTIVMGVEFQLGAICYDIIKQQQARGVDVSGCENSRQLF